MQCGAANHNQFCVCAGIPGRFSPLQADRNNWKRHTKKIQYHAIVIDRDRFKEIDFVRPINRQKKKKKKLTIINSQ